MASTIELVDQKELTSTLNVLAQKLEAPNRTVFGNPGALGLSCFALSTFVTGIFNTGLVDQSVSTVSVPIALFYGGLAQFVAGIIEYRNNNTFGGTALCSYGCFWLSYGLLDILIVPQWVAAGATEDNMNKAVGIFLLAWTIFSVYIRFASLRVAWGVAGLFICMVPALALDSAGSFSGNPHVTAAGGWIGIMTAGAGWYTSAAIVINSTYQAHILPIGVITHNTVHATSQA